MHDHLQPPKWQADGTYFVHFPERVITQLAGLVPDFQRVFSSGEVRVFPLRPARAAEDLADPLHRLIGFVRGGAGLRDYASINACDCCESFTMPTHLSILSIRLAILESRLWGVP